MITWGEFKVDVIFFPRGAPRGDPRMGSPGGVPRGFEGAVRASHLVEKSKYKTLPIELDMSHHDPNTLRSDKPKSQPEVSTKCRYRLDVNLKLHDVVCRETCYFCSVSTG